MLLVLIVTKARANPRYDPYVSLTVSVKNIFDGRTGNVYIAGLTFNKPLTDRIIWNISLQQPFGDNYDFSPTLSTGIVFRIGTKRLTGTDKAKEVSADESSVRVREAH